MEIKFEKPIVPNFIRTKQGTFKITELSEDEFDNYCQLFIETMIEKRETKANRKQV